jgi:hypothetical protein
MGGGLINCGAIVALALMAGACARKDRVAPCAPGEGILSSYAAMEPRAGRVAPGAAVFDGGGPCGPLRLLNTALPVAPAEE